VKKKVFLIPLALVLITSLIACAAPAPAPAPTATVTAPAATVTAPAATVTAPAPAPAGPSEPEFKIAVGAATLGKEVTYANHVFVELMNSRGGGRIEATYFGDGQLGSLEEMMDDVTSGTLEMFTTGTGSLVRLVPWVGASASLPFVWTDWSKCFYWHEKELIPMANEALEQHRVKVLPYVGGDGAAAFYSTSGPIHSPADCKGKVFRSFTPGVETEWMEALGAKAVVIPWSELYTAMETGMVDLMHNPPTYAIDIGFSEVASDMTITNNKIWVQTVIVSLPWWNSLPKDIQDVINSACQDSAAVGKWLTYRSQMESIDLVQQPPYNMNVYFPTAVEMAEFKAAVAPVFDWARNEYGAQYVDPMLEAAAK